MAVTAVVGIGFQAPVIMANTIGNEGFKDAGLEVAWLTPLPWFAELTGGAYQGIATLKAEDPVDLGRQALLTRTMTELIRSFQNLPR